MRRKDLERRKQRSRWCEHFSPEEAPVLCFAWALAAPMKEETVREGAGGGGCSILCGRVGREVGKRQEKQEKT